MWSFDQQSPTTVLPLLTLRRYVAHNVLSHHFNSISESHHHLIIRKVTSSIVDTLALSTMQKSVRDCDVGPDKAIPTRKPMRKYRKEGVNSAIHFYVSWVSVWVPYSAAWSTFNIDGRNGFLFFVSLLYGTHTTKPRKLLILLLPPHSLFWKYRGL